MAVAAPRIITTGRTGAFIDVVYEVGVSGTIRNYYELRTATSGWSQATTETVRNGRYQITSWAGTPLSVNSGYFVRMRSLVSVTADGKTTQQVTDYSNEVEVDPLEIAPPTITSVSRVSGAFIHVTYTAGASGYTRMFYELRTANTNWAPATNETNRNGQYTVTSLGGKPLDPLQTYFVRMTATHTTGRKVGYSNEEKAGPWEVAAPTLIDAIRTGEKTARITLENMLIGAQVIPEIRELPSGLPVTLAAQTIVDDAQWFEIAVPNGASEYTVKVAQRQFGVTSSPTSNQTIDAYWQKPPSATLGTITRAADGTITVPFTGTPGTRTPWTSIVVRWLVAGSTSWQTRTLAGTARTTDIAADPVRAVSVEVLPRNAAGDASSAATATVPAAMTPPSALGAPSVTYDSNGRATIVVEYPTTTPDKAIQSVAIERVALYPDGTRLVTPVGTLNAPATTLYDTPPGNALVQYQSLSRNAAGAAEATSPLSPQVATVPLGAVWLRVRRSGADAVLEWATDPAGRAVATTAETWQLEHTTNPLGANAPEVDWFPRTAPAGEARSATHAGIAVTTHTYRIRPTHALLPSAITVPWRYSNTLAAEAAPLAPILGDPSPLDATGDIILPFTHNPVDGSGQTYAHVRFRKYGTTTWTNRYPGTATFATIPATWFLNGDQIEWQAATRGKHATTGPYASQVFTARARPELSLTAPTHGDTITGSPLVVGWSTSGTVQEVRLTLLDGSGAEIETRSVPAFPTTATFPVSDMGSYAVRAEAWDGYQWSTPAEVNVRVELVKPPRPQLTTRIEGETVVLQAATPTGLNFTRASWPMTMDDWTADLSVREVLLRPEGRIPAVRMGGTQMAPVSTGVPPLDMPADLPFIGVSVQVEGTTSVTVSIDRLQPTYASNFVDGRAVDGVATRGGVANLTGATSFTATVIAAQCLIHSPVLVAAKTAEQAERMSRFDGDTVDPEARYEYGWISPGFAYEAEYTTDGSLGDLGGTVDLEPTSRVEFFRSDDGGKTWLSLGDSDATWALGDRSPALNRTLLYKARAYAPGGGWADSAPVEVVVRSDFIVIDWIDAAGPRTLRGVHNPSLSHSQPTRLSTIKRYAGDEQDTHYYKPRQARTAGFEFDVLDDDQYRSADWLALADYAGPVTYRDPSGLVMTGSLGGSVSWSGSSSIVHRVSLSVSEGVAG